MTNGFVVNDLSVIRNILVNEIGRSNLYRHRSPHAGQNRRLIEVLAKSGQQEGTGTGTGPLKMTLQKI